MAIHIRDTITKALDDHPEGLIEIVVDPHPGDEGKQAADT